MSDNVKASLVAKRTLAPLLSSILSMTRSSQSGANSLSIIPFIPRSVRWLLVFVALLNYRAFPGVWHFRVFSNILAIRLRGILHWFNHTKRRAYIESHSPLGLSPFDLCITYRTTVGVSDADWYGHLSNSAYAKNLDYARMRAAVACFPSVLEARGWMGLGTSCWHFVREIPVMQEYEIRIHIGGWDEKWLNLVVQYVTYPRGKGVPLEDAVSRKDKSKTRAEAENENGSVRRGRSATEKAPSVYRTPLAYTPPTAYVSRATSPIAPRYRRAYSSPNTSNSVPFRSFSDSSLRSTSTTHTTSSTTSYATAPSSPGLEEEIEELDDEEEEPLSGSPTLASGTPQSLSAFTSPSKSPTDLPSVSSSSSNANRSRVSSSATLIDDSPSPSSPESTYHQDKSSASSTLSELPPALSSAMPPLPVGAVLHCIHVSSYVFKHGRITIPPRVALVVSGFGEGEVGRRRWERVQEVRDTKSEKATPRTPLNSGDSSSATASMSKEEEDKLPGGLQGVLRGGWRKYEQEGLWDLPEYEEQRLRALEAFGSLRMHMEGLRPPSNAVTEPEVGLGKGVDEGLDRKIHERAF